MTASFSGVISPPGTRGTTEYSPPRCMFARKRSFVSCSVSCSGLHDVFVPQAGQDRSDGRLADLAAVAVTAVRDDFAERAQLLCLHDGEQFGSREWKVLAQVIDDRAAGLFQFAFQ